MHGKNAFLTRATTTTCKKMPQFCKKLIRSLHIAPAIIWCQTNTITSKCCTENVTSEFTLMPGYGSNLPHSNSMDDAVYLT